MLMRLSARMRILLVFALGLGLLGLALTARNFAAPPNSRDSVAPDNGSVSAKVFADINGNGAMEPEESGLAGVRVAALSGNTPADVALSDDQGGIQLNMAPGAYALEVQLPDGYAYAPLRAGGNGIDPASARSDTITVRSNDKAEGGLIAAVPTADTKTIVGSLSAETESRLTFPLTGAGRLDAEVRWSGDGAVGMSVISPKDERDVAQSTKKGSAQLTVRDAVAGIWQVALRSDASAANYVVTLHDKTTPASTGAIAFARTVGMTGRAEMYPSGLDVDDAGVVYVADTGNDAVAAYGSDGKVLWRTGAYGRGVDELAEPRDVAVTGGRVYVADTGNNRIKVLEAATGRQLAVWPTVYRSIMGISAGVDAAGGAVIIGTEAYPGASAMVIHQPLTGSVIRTIALPTGTGVGQVEEPRDAATGPDGRIYLADFRNHRIAVFSATGTWLRAFASLGAGNDQLNGPYGVDVDAAGNIYVADSNNSTIKKFSPEYKFVASVGVNGKGNGQFFQLRRAVVGAGSNPLVYGADLWGNKVEVFTNAGALTRTLGGSHPPTGGFNKPYGLALTATDMLVADTANHRVQRFTYAGKFLSSFGERGFGEDLSGLNWERDVAVSPSGMIWVADSKNNRLLEFTAAGAATGKALGRLGSANGQFNWPYALSFLGSDLVVADTFNDRVQRVTRDGVVLWTLSGLAKPRDVTVVGNTVFVADSDHHVIVRVDGGTGVKLSTFGEAALHSPDGLAVAPDGTVFVADTSWHRVVEFNKDGVFMRAFGKRGTGQTQFNRPSKIEIRAGGSQLEMFITDTANDRIQVYSLN